METASDIVEQIVRRDRLIVTLALILVAVLAWVYTFAGVGMPMSAVEMTRATAGEAMPGSSMPMSMSQWSVFHSLVMFGMWWVMMIAMMLPSAAPTILLAAAINRRSSQSPPYGPTSFFAAGYLLAWAAFSVVAVAAQWALNQNGQLSVTFQSQSDWLNGGLLLAAGLWQLTPIKQSCLRHCRSPVHYLTQNRRPGNRGALVMGVGHGTYCLGCCWFLMLLLFAGGVMNLYWIAGLALFVLVEKVLSRGVWFGRLAGLGLIVAGLATMI